MQEMQSGVWWPYAEEVQHEWCHIHWSCDHEC